MKISTSKYLSVLLICLLAACTGLPVKESADALQTKTICCNNFAELKFQPLRVSDRQKFDLDTNSQVMNFNEGKSYLIALTLPNGVSKLTIQTLNGDGSGYLPKSSFADPVVVVLDSNKNEIQRFKELSFRIVRVNTFGNFLFEQPYSANVQLRPEAKYLVAYANNSSKRVLVAFSESGARHPVPPATIGTFAFIAD